MASTHKLRVVIFAGGIGTRMWPLSRKVTPKQFEKIVGSQSTLQLAVERVRPDVDLDDIYISTGQEYVEIVREQLPEIPEKNIIGEPTMRDVAPAVGYLMSILAEEDPLGPVAILWSDHLVKHVDRFKAAVKAGADYLQENPEKFVFLGQKARFPNQNLGWIEQGDKLKDINGFSLHKFVSWHYRPDQETAAKYFASGNHSWNPGYFIVTPQFVLSQYREHAPDISAKLTQLMQTYGTPAHESALQKIYPTFEKISFDDAVISKTPPEKAVVLTVDLGWSDVGTWEALKEAIQVKPYANIVQGQVHLHGTENSLVYNYTDQMVTVIGMRDLIVVVTPDVVMVVPQDKIPEVKSMLAGFEGTDKEKYT